MKTSKFFFSFTALLLTLLCSSLQASAYDYYDSYSSYYYDGTAEMEEALRKGHAAATLEDYVTAESYFLQAANLGSAEAQCCLGIIYSDSSLTLYNPTKALFYLNESAKNGYSYVLDETGSRRLRRRSHQFHRTNQRNHLQPTEHTDRRIHLQLSRNLIIRAHI